MARQALNIIKNWFKTGLKPTQNQFWDTWDSFWHKDEKIPTNAIENLDSRFNEKADQGAFLSHLNDINAHNGLLAAKANLIGGNTFSGSQTINLVDFSDGFRINAKNEDDEPKSLDIKASYTGHNIQIGSPTNNGIEIIGGAGSFEQGAPSLILSNNFGSFLDIPPGHTMDLKGSFSLNGRNLMQWLTPALLVLDANSPVIGGYSSLKLSYSNTHAVSIVCCPESSADSIMDLYLPANTESYEGQQVHVKCQHGNYFVRIKDSLGTQIEEVGGKVTYYFRFTAGSWGGIVNWIE
jgi:hypothetical protein